jgi:hypothetical protein
MDTDRNAPVLSATTRFIVESYSIEGEVILLFEIGAFDTLTAAVDTSYNSI